MILVFLVLVVVMLLGGLILLIRSKGWVRLFAVLLLAVALSPVGLWVWWEYWGNEVLLTASPGKIVSMTSDTGQTVQVASGTRAHPISVNDGSCGTHGSYHLVRVRLTEGEHKGMTARVCSDNITRLYGVP